MSWLLLNASVFELFWVFIHSVNNLLQFCLEFHSDLFLFILSGCARKWWAPWSQGKLGQCHYKLSTLSHNLVLLLVSSIPVTPAQNFFMSNSKIWFIFICHHFIIFYICLIGSPRRARTSRSAGNPRNSGETQETWPVSHAWDIKAFQGFSLYAKEHRHAYTCTLNLRKQESSKCVFNSYGIFFCVCIFAGNARTSGSPRTPRREGKKPKIYKVTQH